MTRSALLTCALLAALVLDRPRASAQTPTAHVSVRDLTVEGRDPPRYLREALDDNTVGVMRGFDRCFAERSRVVSGLAGELRIHMYVSAQQVIRVTPDATTFSDDDLVACIKRTLLAFALPPDAPRGGATVAMRVVFTATAPGTVVVCDASRCSDTPCGALGQPCCPASTCGEGVCAESRICEVPPPPPPPPPTVALRVTRARGAITVDELTAALTLDALVPCVDGSVSGRVPMSVTVSRTGRVSVSPLRGTLRDRTVIACLRAALRARTLPARTRSTSARIEIAVGAAAAEPWP